jgi:hypothetical protein
MSQPGNLLANRLLRHSDTDLVNMLWRHVGACNRYLTFLHVIVERFEAVAAEFRLSLERFEALSDAARAAAGTPEGAGRQLTAPEIEEQDRQSAIGMRVQLEVESFYVFAKIVLDRVADLFGALFSVKYNRPGSEHGQLADRARRSEVAGEFSKVCQRLGIVDDCGLGSKLVELDERVIQYRDDFIEHLPKKTQQSRVYGVAWSPDEIHASLTFWRTADADPENVESENARKLLADIMAYVGMVLAFAETHLDKSCLGDSRP